MRKLSCIIGAVVAADIILLCLLGVYWPRVRAFLKASYKVTILIVSVAGIVFVSCLLYESSLIIKIFFDKYKNVFTGIGYTAVAIALFVTAYQIWTTKKQAIASVSFQLNKYSAKIIDSLNSEHLELIKSCHSLGDLDNQKAEKVKRTIAKILRWYNLACLQNYYNNIERKEWDVIESNFRNFLKKDIVTEYWELNVKKKNGWDEVFVDLGEKLISERGQT